MAPGYSLVNASCNCLAAGISRAAGAMLETTYRFAFSAGPAGPASSCGVKPGPSATIGTVSPTDLATAAADAVCAGPAEIRIALTPATRSADTWADRSVS